MATETDFDEIVKYTQNGTAEADEKEAESVKILSNEYEEDWAVYPFAVARAMRFCDEFEPQANSGELKRQLYFAFAQDDPQMRILGFFKGEQLIGHMLFDRSVLYYKWVTSVHQYYLDSPISRETRDRANQLVKEWASRIIPGADEIKHAEFIQWFVRDRKLARLYQIYFKGKVHAAVMRTPIEE